MPRREEQLSVRGPARGALPPVRADDTWRHGPPTLRYRRRRRVRRVRLTGRGLVVVAGDVAGQDGRPGLRRCGVEFREVAAEPCGRGIRVGPRW
jgi:hypothetical protein